MKHICYLSSSIQRDDVLIISRQGVSLVSNGFKVSYMVTDNKEDEIHNGIKILSTGYSPSSRFKRMLFSSRYLYKKAIDQHADIYQISEPELIPLGLRLIKRGYKVIFNMREDYPSLILRKYYIPRIFRKLISKIIENYMKRSLKKFNAVFSVTPDLVNITKSKWKCKNSYLLANFPLVNKDFNLSYNEYVKRGDVICYIGTIYNISRQELIFEILENYPKIQYIIAGKFWGKYGDQLKSLPYWKHVEFIDGFKISEMPSIYARASISNVLRDFSYTSTPNGSLGVLKIFESMEAALPIICSDVPVYRQMIEKYKCGICVDPNNKEQIENAIRFLINNKNIAYQMGQNGRRAIIEEYNWNSQAILYIEVILRILNDDN